MKDEFRLYSLAIVNVTSPRCGLENGDSHWLFLAEQPISARLPFSQSLEIGFSSCVTELVTFVVVGLAAIEAV